MDDEPRLRGWMRWPLLVVFVCAAPFVWAWRKLRGR